MYTNTELNDRDNTERVVLYTDRGQVKGSFKTEEQAISYAKKIGFTSLDLE